MLSLCLGDLRVDLLDPEREPERHGLRYCRGGYIWQVHDARVGPLVRGPEWPKPAPVPYNGQGLPESFRYRTRAGRPLTWDGNQGILIGGGTLATSTSGQVELVTPCPWTWTLHPDRMVFRTSQEAFGYAYDLVRTVSLEGRAVISSSELTNRSSTALPLEWFPHPFFALTDHRIHVELPERYRLPENPGFELENRRLSLKRRFEGELDGHMDFLEVDPQVPLKAQLSHPHLDGVAFETSYAPAECPIWANGNTFSLEPYLATTLPPGATHCWRVQTRFGTVA